MVVEALWLGVVAVMVAVPGPTAVTNPVETTVATELLLVVQLTAPSAPRAASCTLPPTSRLADGVLMVSCGLVGSVPPLQAASSRPRSAPNAVRVTRPRETGRVAL